MALLLTPTTIACTLVLAILIVSVRRRYFTPVLCDLPGPFAASFSLIWQLYHTIAGDTEKQIVKLHRKHGKFVRISHREVSISDPISVQEVLMKPWTKGDWYEVFSLPNHRFVNQMSECDPRRHIEKNKNIMNGYSITSLLRSEKYVDKCISLMCERFEAIAAAGTRMDPSKWFRYMAFDILGEMTFSQSFGFLEKGYDIGGAIKMTGDLALYIAIMGFLPWLHNMMLGNPLVEMLGLQPNQHIFDTTMATMETRAKNPGARKDMVEQWTERYHAVKEKGLMEEKEILCAALANIGAGAGTVNAVLQAFFYYMIRNPEFMKKARDEVDEAVAAGELSYPVAKYTEAQRLPIVQACLKEVYRIHPPVGFGLPRIVPEEGATIAGRFFPGGTTVSVCIWAIHRNKEIYGEDVDAFNPARWLIDDTTTLKLREKLLIPFGAGHNRCLGQNLAQLELSKTIATLLRRFDLTQEVPDKARWKYVNRFTVIPYGWEVDIKKREEKGM